MPTKINMDFSGLGIEKRETRSDKPQKAASRFIDLALKYGTPAEEYQLII